MVVLYYIIYFELAEIPIMVSKQAKSDQIASSVKPKGSKWSRKVAISGEVIKKGLT